ncbi:MAG: hypothetical protein V1855_03380 [bacterium]
MKFFLKTILICFLLPLPRYSVCMEPTDEEFVEEEVPAVEGTETMAPAEEALPIRPAPTPEPQPIPMPMQTAMTPAAPAAAPMPTQPIAQAPVEPTMPITITPTQPPIVGEQLKWPNSIELSEQDISKFNPEQMASFKEIQKTIKQIDSLINDIQKSATDFREKFTQIDHKLDDFFQTTSPILGELQEGYKAQKTKEGL